MSRLRDWNELAKSRIVLLSLAVAAGAFVLGSGGAPVAYGVLGALLGGLALVGAGCGAFNQVLERDLDKRMKRTANRPLPTGRMSLREAIAFGTVTSILGLVVLAVWVNSLTSFLAFLTLLSYVAIYTPMKRKSAFSTLIGAVPGALPPLMGWTAARNAVELEGVILFGILFLWQIPHFLAIGWMYKDEYANAGFPLLSHADDRGVVAAQQALLYTALLLPLTVLPTMTGLAGRWYLYGALLLGGGFLFCAFHLFRERTRQSARRLFFASILYLPALGTLLCWDRVL